MRLLSALADVYDPDGRLQAIVEREAGLAGWSVAAS